MPATKYGRSQKSATTTATGKLKKPDTYVCTRCGAVFNKADHRKKFTTVKSPLWESNEYKLPVCDDCLKFYYDFYLRALGDPHSAYRRICMKFDIYYSDDIVNSILAKEQSADRIGLYISQLNYARYQGKTYDNTIEEENGKYLYGDCVYETEDEDGNPINIKVEYEKLKEQIAAKQNGQDSAPIAEEDNPEYVKVFGVDTGFTPREQSIMISYYNEQINNIPNQLITTLAESVKDMARFKILQSRAIAANDMKEITNYSNQYNASRKIIDTAIEKFRKNATDEENSVLLGTLIESIEQFCPAEIYKKKGVFADVDGIKSLYERFILRPTKNFFKGTRDLDPEFKIE